MGKKELRESVGLLAVVLSLVFVGVEMRQNTDLMRAQIRNAMSENQIAVQLARASSLETARVSRLTFEDPESLSLDEYTMATRFLNALFREWENSHYQYQRGLFTEDEYEARTRVWRGLMDRPFLKDRWIEDRQGYATSFQSEIDRIIEEAAQDD